MTKHRTIIAAAAFAVAGLTAPWGLAGEQPGHNAGTAQQPADPKGNPEQTNPFDKTPRTPEPVSSAKLAPDAEQIRSSLARIADAALGGDVQSLWQQLDKADQARLNITPNANELKRADESSDLQQAVSQLKKDWKEKYGQELRFQNQQGTFSDQFARIIESNPAENSGANTARTAAERIPPGDRNTSAAPHADIDRSKDVDQAGDKSTDKNLSGQSEKSADRSAQGVSSPSTDFNKANTSSAKSGTVEMRGTDRPANQTSDVKVATVTVPASHGAPQVTIHLTSDSSGQWRVDIPNTLDQQKLQTNLAKHVRQFDEQKGVWPKDVAEASRMAAHHVFLALADKDTAAPHQGDHGNADLNHPQGRDTKPNNTVVPPGTSGTIDSSQRNPR